MKLPVFTAFGAAIAYVTSHFLTLLRIVWLPALLLTGVTFYLMPAASPHHPNVCAWKTLATARTGGKASGVETGLWIFSRLGPRRAFAL